MNDYISRQDAIDAWKNDFKGYINALDIPKDDYKGIMEYIDELPSVQPKRKTGRWIPYEYGDERWHQCTACGVADKYIDYVKGYDGKPGKLVSVRHYCPNCGARMKRDDSD